MGSEPKAPPPPPKPPPPVRATGADAAQDAIEAKKQEAKRYSFERTILQPGTLSPMPQGTRSTL